MTYCPRMIKNCFLASILFLIVAASSCKKNNDAAITPGFRIDSLKDYYIDANIDTVVKVTLNIYDSAQSGVKPTITATNLPQGLYLNSTDSALFFYGNIVNAGTYPISLVCTSPGRKSQKVSFNLVVLASVYGSWTGNDSTDITLTAPNYSATVTSAGPSMVKISMPDFYFQGFLETNHNLEGAIYNYSHNTVISTGAYGTYSPNKITLRYIYTAAQSHNVSTVLTR